VLRRIVDHFPSGELQFDAFNRLGIKSQWSKRRWCGVRGRRCIGASDGPRRHHRAVPRVPAAVLVSAIDDDRSPTSRGTTGRP